MKNKIRIVVSSPENVNNEVNKVGESVSGIVLINSDPLIHPPNSSLGSETVFNSGEICRVASSGIS